MGFDIAFHVRLEEYMLKEEEKIRTGEV